MAGAAIHDPAMDARMRAQGLIYDAPSGGYVTASSINPATGKRYDGSDPNQAQTQSNPWAASPDGTGAAQNPNRGSTVPNPNANGLYGPGGVYSSGGGGGGGVSAASPQANSGGVGNTDAITSLISEIRGQSGPQATPIVTSQNPSPYNDASDRAEYGAAKERTGLATQSALKALREQLSSRGLGEGSGLEGEMTTGIIRGGLGELANTDRQMAQQSASQAFTANQADTDRLISQNQFNATGIPNYNLSKWGLLAQLAGMLY